MLCISVVKSVFFNILILYMLHPNSQQKINCRISNGIYLSFHLNSQYSRFPPKALIELLHGFNIPITIFRYEKRCPVIGTMWDGEWTNKTIITRDGNPVGGHQVFTNGWNKDGLIIQNSYGNITPQGRHVFTREMVNKRFSFGGVSMFVDMSAEEVERLKRRNSGSWWQWLLDFLSNWD